jgi:hypothetical protein
MKVNITNTSTAETASQLYYFYRLRVPKKIARKSFTHVKAGEVSRGRL